MTLELADRSITEPIGIAKDVRLMVGKFQFLADFVVVDFEPDPRVPLILGRSSYKTVCLIDVSEENLPSCCKGYLIQSGPTSMIQRLNYNHMTDEPNSTSLIWHVKNTSQDVIVFLIQLNGTSYPDYDPIVSNSSPTLTPFGDSDFLLLREANAFIAVDEQQFHGKLMIRYYDPEA
ncbi:hypothetical protein Tco_0769242 [Tanacetum coccineum]|uniref:Uncharacterized protein n=1 Tax=Tanacetum coccineum TaxID=301880 RepID=A0ABQ4ZAL6_9ASTR